MYLQVTKEIKAWVPSANDKVIHVFSKEYSKEAGFTYIEESPTYERVVEFCNQHAEVCGFKINKVLPNMVKIINSKTKGGVKDEIGIVNLTCTLVDVPICVTFLEKFIKTTTYRFDLVDAFIRGRNITCSAVAGSGKTTSLLDLCELVGDKNIIILTYNKRLQLDIESRLPYEGNVKAYTFHGYAGKVFGSTVNNDVIFESYMDGVIREGAGDASSVSSASSASVEQVLGKYVKAKVSPDILMVDEAQDLTELYANFVDYIGCTQLVLMGDPNQAINKYKGANIDYLINPETYFHRTFAHCTLPYSYRLTPPMARFVNNHIFRRELIIGVNKANDKKPYCLVASSLKESVDLLIKSVKGALKKFEAHEILILIPSTFINQNTYCSILGEFTKEMKRLSIPVDIDNWTNASGIGVLNYSSCKGYQRRCVIVVGMDESYFKYYNKDFKSTSDELIPNVINVVASRAADSLVLICGKKLLRSFDVDKLDDLIIHGEYETGHIVETNYIADEAHYTKTYFSSISIPPAQELVIEQLLNPRYYGTRTITEACQDANLIQCKLSGRETDICKITECNVSHGVVSGVMDKLKAILAKMYETNSDEFYFIVRASIADIQKLTKTYSVKKYGNIKIIDMIEGCVYNF